MANPHNLTVGQELFLRGNKWHPEPWSLRITKIGRKWVSLENRDRCDIDTLEIDGMRYSSPGKCYLSREEILAEDALSSAWGRFRSSVYSAYSPPCDLDAIKAAAAALGFASSDEPDTQ